MNKALILGCSHASGCDLTANGDYTFELTHSYPALLATALGYELVNLAFSGGSNDAIFRLYEENLKNLEPDDIIIACWTGANRSEFWSREAQAYLKLCPGATDFKNNEHERMFRQWVELATDHPFGLTARLNKMKNILALNLLAQANQHSVININSFWPVKDVDWKDSIFWPIDDNFCKWAYTQKFSETANGHYELSAHEKFSEFLLKPVKSFLNIT